MNEQLYVYSVDVLSRKMEEKVIFIDGCRSRTEALRKAQKLAAVAKAVNARLIGRESDEEL